MKKKIPLNADVDARGDKSSNSNKDADPRCISRLVRCSSLSAEALMRENYKDVVADYTFYDNVRNLGARVVIWPDGMSELTGHTTLIDILCEQLPEFRSVGDGSLPDGVRIYRRVRDLNGKEAFSAHDLGDNTSVPLV